MLTTYQKVFTIDGVNLEDLKWNNVNYKYNTQLQAAAKKFSANKISLLAAFLGLPHRLLAPAQNQSLMNLVKNFFGWRDSVFISKNIIMMPVMTVMNVILTPLKFIFNLVKIFTEFLPMLANEKLLKLQSKYYAAGIAEWNIESVPLFILAGLSYLGGKAAAVLLFAGQHVTSPNLALRQQYNRGKVFGQIWGRSSGFVAGVVLMTLSFYAVVTLYVVCMPLGMKYLATKLPASVTAVINSIGAALGSFLDFMANLSLGFTVAEVTPSAAVGFAGMIAMSTSIFGLLARKVSSKFKASYHAFIPAPVIVNLVPVTVKIAEEKSIQESPTNQSASTVEFAGVSPSSPLRMASIFPPANDMKTHDDEFEYHPLQYAKIPSLP